jgi:hypothetical protein
MAKTSYNLVEYSILEGEKKENEKFVNGERMLFLRGLGLIYMEEGVYSAQLVKQILV